MGLRSVTTSAWLLSVAPPFTWMEKTMKLIYIGDHFYRESGTLMSSLYTEDGKRSDWGFVSSALHNGENVEIRQVTDAEREYYETQLSKIRGQKTIDIQRLRNLTTRILHTKVSHIYEDLENITGEKGLMTHMLPRVIRAVEPWLRDHVKDVKFWDGKYDTRHTGDYVLSEPTESDRKAMIERYYE